MCSTVQGVHQRLFILIECFLREIPDLSPRGNMQIFCVQYSLDLFSTLTYCCGKLVEFFHILVAPLCYLLQLSYLLQQYEISMCSTGQGVH